MARANPPGSPVVRWPWPFLLLAAVAAGAAGVALGAAGPVDRSGPPHEPVVGRGEAPPFVGPRWAPGEVVVKFRKSALRTHLPPQWRDDTRTGIPAFDALAEAFKFQEVRRYFGDYRPLSAEILDPSRVALYRFSSDADPLLVARALRRLAEVEYAHPHFLEQPNLIPDDPLESSQWHLSKIRAREAWDVESDCAGVTLAIDDTGMDFSHEDLVPNLWLNPDEDVTTPGALTPDDCNGVDDGPDRDGDGLAGNGYVDDFFGANDGWCSNNDPYVPPRHEDWWLNLHGTHVGGIAGARGDNGVGIAGICWAPTLMDRGPLPYLADMGADVVNRSYNHSLCSDGAPTVTKEEVDYAWSRGTIVVYSAGNDNRYLSALPPACAAPSLEVAATTGSDTRSGFSNFGPAVSVSAPGSAVLSAIPTGWPVYPTGSSTSVPCAPDETDPSIDCYAGYSGTSQAAPVITGVLGLAIAAHRDDPAWYDPACPMGAREPCDWAPPAECPPCGPSPAKVVAHVKGTAESIDDHTLDTWGWLGQGRVDAFRAVSETGPVPQLRAVAVAVHDPAPDGDGDADAEFGEEVELIVTVAQRYGDAGGPVAGTLGVHPGYAGLVTVTKPSAWFGEIPAGEQRDCASDPFRVAIDSAELAERVYFHVDLDDGAGYTTRETVGLLLGKGGEPGFPAPVLEYAPTFSVDFGQPTLVDLDGDGALESVFTADGAIRALHADGAPVAGFPILHPTTTFGDASNSQPVVAEDVDLDGRFEFLAGCTSFGSTLTRRGLCAVRSDGTELADGDGDPGSWGVFVEFNAGNRLRTPPALADLDGDARPDVILTTASTPGELLAVDATGQPLPGFPVVPPAGFFYHGAVAVGDLDQDGVPEIVTARATVDPDCPTPTSSNHCDADQVLEVRDAAGVLRWSSPVDVAADRANAPAPLVADVDGDGSPDVVSATGAHLYVFDADGDPLPGSPIVVPVEPFGPGQGPTSCRPEDGFTHVVELESLLPAADLDGDGTHELVVRDEQILHSPVFNFSQQRIVCRRHVRVVRWDGTAGALSADPPITLLASEKPRSPLLVADFGAGAQVLYANDAAIETYDAGLLGRKTRFFDSRRWPTTTSALRFPAALSLCAGDVDADGVVEVQIPLNDGSLHAWGIDRGAPGAVLWGSPHHDRWMTRNVAATPPSSYACDALTTEGTLTRDEGWGPQCSPVQLTGPLTVPPGIVLTVWPGTIVEATDPSAALIVDGTLSIAASRHEPVTFGAPGGTWQGIRLRTDATSALTGLEIRDAQAGLRLENVSPSLTWVRLASNVAGIEVEGINGRPSLERVLFAGNDVGLRLVAGAQPWPLMRAVFHGNGTGLDNSGNSVATLLSDSIFRGNSTDVAAAPPPASVSVAYSIVESTVGYDEGAGVLHLDPRFVDPAAGDFHLLGDSPAIDAASPTSGYLSEPDPNGCRANMGLYGDTAEATARTGEVNHCACTDLTVEGTLAADTTWTPACNPIRLQGPLTVPAGVTLAILPGTRVEGGTADSGIVVDGLLDAAGDRDEPVVFAGYAGGAWAGLDLRAPGAHRLRFAEVRDAVRTRVASGAAIVERSRFLDNVAGLVLEAAVPVVRNNVFARNTNAVEALGDASPRIDRSTFHSNGTAVRDTGLAAGRSVVVADAILWNNADDCEPVAGAIVVRDSIAGSGTGCSLVDPVGGTPEFVDAATDDYHQTATSAGIDAGDPGTDYFEEPDPNGCRVNLGAYGDTEEATSDPGTDHHCNCHYVTVSGGIDPLEIATWTIDCSPIRLQSDFEIAGVLLVDPGVVVEVPGYEIDVTGWLLANGTAESPITFRRHGAARWDGLVLRAAGEHRLEHVRIEGAERVEALGSELLLRRSEIVAGGTGLIVHGAPTVENVLFAANDLALDVRSTSGVVLDHLTVVRNADGLASAALQPTVVRNSIFWFNADTDVAGSVDLRYSITEGTGGPMEGPGVLHLDPEFASVHPAGDWRQEDYHVQEGSPAIDGGDPAADYVAEAFANGCRADMGAYGNTPESTPSPSDEHCYCPGVPSSHRGPISEDETWEAACGPHIVYGLVEVLPGATLTIEAGTTVQFREAPAESPILKIHGGRLMAIGTPAARIVFEDGDGQHTGRIQCFNNYGNFPECRLAYFDLEGLYGYYSLTSLIGPHVDSLEHGRFRDNFIGVHASYTASPLIRNCLFEGHDVAVYGGQRGYPRIENSTFVRNGTGVGVGAFPFEPDPITITNSIFWGNTDRDLDGWQPGDPRIVLRYTLTERAGEAIEEAGVLHVDPLFMDLAGGDYRLQPASPAIDAGDPASPFAAEPDPDGCRINLGHDGNAPTATVSSDPDGDLLHGACDTCPLDPDDDADGDGVCGDLDCAPADPDLSGPPAPITGLHAGADKVRFAWDPAGSGNGETYDVARASLADLPAGGGDPSETCLTPGGTAETEIDDPDVPPAGTGFWYLVRGSNVCGHGTFGEGSTGVGRPVEVCP